MELFNEPIIQQKVLSDIIKNDNIITNSTMVGGSFSGGKINIGSGENIFTANKDGIFLGSSSFETAPFSVDMKGNMVASSATIAGDITSSNFVYDPETGELTGYKLEYSTGNAYFGGAIVAGSSTIGTLGTTANAIGSAIDSSGNLIKDVVNTNLSTLSKQILGDFTFGSSGAIKMITDANNGLWLSPTGILGKKEGVTTFAIGIDGSPTFRGEITGGSININNSWHVDTSGNMWWGNSSTYAGATYRISSEGVANLSGLTVGTNVALGSAVDAIGVASIISIDYLNAKGITAGSVAAENITGTYITGKTIQTAISGSRVEIRSAAPFSDQIVFYYGTDANPNGQIYASSGALKINNPVAGGAITLGTADGLALTIFGTSLLAKTINPSGTTETLGSSTYPWYGLHLSSSTANFNGDFIPVTNGTISGGQTLGSSSYKFYNVNSFFGTFDYLGKNLDANTYNITNLGSLVVNNGGSITLGGETKTSWPTGETGTVTSIATGDGLSGGTITTTGTLTVDSTVIRTTGDQTLGGIKTFSSPVVIATPTSDMHATTKAYVDTAVSGAGTGTVTSIATGTGLTGGTITSSGTISIDSTVIRTTGDQSMAGTKTFTGKVKLPVGTNLY